MSTPTPEKLEQLRRRITESLRVQRETDAIEYIDVGNALSDATSRQNHAIFARRGCGKTLLLRTSAGLLSEDTAAIYLNCENFKRHSFPNVLIEILRSLFTELSTHLTGWFGRKHKSKALIDEILARLTRLEAEQDSVLENIKALEAASQSDQFDLEGALKGGPAKLGMKISSGGTRREEIERTYQLYREKIERLDIWLPELKRNVESFLQASRKVKVLIIQIDDLYHLRRTDQAFVVDYIHRLCKDLPLYFKVATLRHASTLYVDRHGQPIGAQERHDYQSINIDYTFGEFAKTSSQNWKILLKFASDVKMNEAELDSLFKGEGWQRLVMAGGGVPRDVLSLFLDILSQTDVQSGGKIGNYIRDKTGCESYQVADRPALSELAELLYRSMERIDPSVGSKPWGQLTDGQRQFYELALEDALDNFGKLSAVLGPDDDMIARRADAGEKSHLN